MYTFLKIYPLEIDSIFLIIVPRTAILRNKNIYFFISDLKNMGDDIDFVSKFHSLEGNLVGERTKNFSMFLNKLAFSNEQQIELFFKNLKPQTYLEHLFRIDTLIHFKKTSQLLDILKGDNEVYRAKVMKQQWFFEDAFNNIDAETLVNEFVPQLTFKDRRKCIYKILKTVNEEQSDQIVNALYLR